MGRADRTCSEILLLFVLAVADKHVTGGKLTRHMTLILQMTEPPLHRICGCIEFFFFLEREKSLQKRLYGSVRITLCHSMPADNTDLLTPNSALR